MRAARRASRCDPRRRRSSKPLGTACERRSRSAPPPPGASPSSAISAPIPRRGAVAALVKSWKPDFVITAGDNNYPRGEAATIDANIGKYYAEFIGNYTGEFGPGSATNRFWPSLGQPRLGHTVLAPYLDYFTLPGNGRYYDVDRGLVHLYAIDSDLHEPDGTTPTSTQANGSRSASPRRRLASTSSYFHPAPDSTGEHGSTEGMRWPMAVGRRGGDHRARSRLRAIQRRRHPLLRQRARRGPEVRLSSPQGPRTQVRFNDGYGAMLVKATPADITYEFFSTDGTRLDAITVPANCK